ncbi:hypothetical protein E2C01_054959 [Portunus trituberculatus]|uniref:Uncharacterized protein n=1 Tax=Portunus trituberculatus TaxID=210409 RepID=A0A5B7GTB9_PORTR|nr:hypothetical protein [Portunus trituberculatus]
MPRPKVSAARGDSRTLSKMNVSQEAKVVALKSCLKKRKKKGCVECKEENRLDSGTYSMDNMECVSQFSFCSSHTSTTTLDLDSASTITTTTTTSSFTPAILENHVCLNLRQEKSYTLKEFCLEDGEEEEEEEEEEEGEEFDLVDWLID